MMTEILFGNGAPFAAGRVDYAPDPEQTRQANMAFNRWVIDFCSEAPDRLHGQALVSFDDIDQAVKDVYWAKEQGLVGILMPPLYPGSKFFFDPALDPIWAACTDVGLPLSQHGGTGAPDYQPQIYAAFMVLAAEHSFFSGRSLWQLILGGVFDRFPELKIAFIETEAWWIAPMMNLLDGRERAADDWTDFAESLRQAKPYSRLPSEYWKTNCYAGISPFHPSQVTAGDLSGAGDAERRVQDPQRQRHVRRRLPAPGVDLSRSHRQCAAARGDAECDGGGRAQGAVRERRGAVPPRPHGPAAAIRSRRLRARRGRRSPRLTIAQAAAR